MCQYLVPKRNHDSQRHDRILCKVSPVGIFSIFCRRLVDCLTRLHRQALEKKDQDPLAKTQETSVPCLMLGQGCFRTLFRENKFNPFKLGFTWVFVNVLKMGPKVEKSGFLGCKSGREMGQNPLFIHFRIHFQDIDKTPILNPL